jgi:hypothetical protein
MNLIIKQCKVNNIYIICINDEIEVNQILEEKKNPSLQTKVNKVSRKSNENKTK